MIEEKRAGFIAVIGSPNAGKSTLINHFIGQKVTIVTRKVQTTRSVIRGICIHKESQLVFSDTPGIFEPKRRLDRAMVEAAWGSSSDADIILFLYDAQKSGIDSETNKILHELGQSRQKKILVLNKVDLVDNKTLLPLIKNFEAICSFDATFIISALTGEGSKKKSSVTWQKTCQKDHGFIRRRNYRSTGKALGCRNHERANIYEVTPGTTICHYSGD